MIITIIITNAVQGARCMRHKRAQFSDIPLHLAQNMLKILLRPGLRPQTPPGKLRPPVASEGIWKWGIVGKGVGKFQMAAA